MQINEHFLVLFLQILPEIFPEVQSELLEECGESEGYATVSGKWFCFGLKLLKSRPLGHKLGIKPTKVDLQRQNLDLNRRKSTFKGKIWT